MKTPTIHLNGTSRAALLESYCDAGAAVRQALDKLADAAPNGRDYYTQGGDAIGVAVAEHVDRLRRLESVLAELSELAEAVDQFGRTVPS